MRKHLEEIGAALLGTVKGLIGSKKFITAFIGLVGLAIGKRIGLDDAQVMEFTGIVGALLIAQGSADFGKAGRPAA